MSVRAVLLDAGNTLVGLDHEALAGICAAHGLPVEPEAVARADGRLRRTLDRLLSEERRSTEAPGTRAVLVGLFLEGLAVPESDRPAALIEELVERLPSLFRRPEDGVGDALVALEKRGYRLGVVSNSDGSLEEGLSALGLRHHFEFVLDSAIVGVEKPDPAIFRLALERLDVPATAAVYVGDLPSIDVRGARAAGIAAILVDPFDNFPDATVPRIRSLPDLLHHLR
jgi:putative hydrolase of the HAD superfamily